MRGTYPRPKDSNAAVRVHNRATGKVLEGTDGQTDRQTDFPPIIVRSGDLLLVIFCSLVRDRLSVPGADHFIVCIMTVVIIHNFVCVACGGVATDPPL